MCMLVVWYLVSVVGIFGCGGLISLTRLRKVKLKLCWLVGYVLLC